MGPAMSALGPRREGWEARLAEVIESARSRPYRLGEHDCFRFACAAVEALVGLDLWAPWGGRYSTRLGALRLIAEYADGVELEAASVFTRAFSRLFRGRPVPTAQAERGDVVEYVDEIGAPHLGVVNGARAAVLVEGGLAFVARSACRHCWRIG
jgi:hypothetical protein